MDHIKILVVRGIGYTEDMQKMCTVCESGGDRVGTMRGEIGARRG